MIAGEHRLWWDPEEQGEVGSGSVVTLSRELFDELPFARLALVDSGQRHRRLASTYCAVILEEPVGALRYSSEPFRFFLTR
jgi:hypothetical protein